MAYSQYKKASADLISKCISELCCQPIIFAGAGLSKRYISGPSWISLLDLVAKENPEIDKDIAFFKQKFKNLPEVGEQLVPYFHSWAWAVVKKISLMIYLNQMCQKKIF